MSYILDALRKADAQRERDPARGIHAQPTPLAGAPATQSDSRKRWLWITGVLGLALLVGAGWYLSEHRSAVPAPSSVAAAAPAPARPVAMLPTPAAMSPAQPPVTVSSAIAPPPPVTRTAPPRDPTNTSVPPMRGAPQTGLVPPDSPEFGTPMARRAAAAREAAMAAQVTVPPAPPAAAPARPPISATAPPASTPPATTPPATTATQQAATGLPPDAPRLVISGGVYSTSPAQRMLIVNGLVFNEGSEVAPGVTVEEIKPRTAVLKFRGTRYTVAY